MDVNVYQEISRRGYVCTGKTHYSREEMESMLMTADLSLSEMKTIYYLNYDAAMAEVDTIRDNFQLSPESGYDRLGKDCSIRRRVSKSLAGSHTLLALGIIQGFVSVGWAIRVFRGDDILLISIIVLIALSWLLAFVLTYSGIGGKVVNKREEEIACDIVDRMYAYAKDILAVRKRTLQEIENTTLMYDVMYQYLKDNNCLKNEPDDDDNDRK